MRLTLTQQKKEVISCGGYEDSKSFNEIANQQNILDQMSRSNTYDHRSVKTGHPVRSAIHKH